MLENPLFIIIVLITFLVGIIILLVVNKRLAKRDTIEVINEAVTQGEITREQGDAFIWLLYEYKSNKRKRK